MVNLLYPQAHRATVGGSKDRIMIFFKTTLTRDYSKPTRVKNIYGYLLKNLKFLLLKNLKTKKQSEDTISKNITNTKQ